MYTPKDSDCQEQNAIHRRIYRKLMIHDAPLDVLHHFLHLGPHNSRRSGQELCYKIDSSRSFSSCKIRIYQPGDRGYIPWNDYARGESGGNIVTFLMYVLGRSYESILEQAADLVNVSLRPAPKIPNLTGDFSKGNATPVKRRHAYIGKLPPWMRKDYRLAEQFLFHDKRGIVIGVESRLEALYPKPGERNKRPSWQSMDEDGWWTFTMPAVPRPLYNRHIFERSDAPAMLHEGARKAEVGKLLYPEYLHSSCPNGANSAKDVDLKPLHHRELCLWPDFDKAGYFWIQSLIQNMRAQDVTPRGLWLVKHDHHIKGYDIVDHVGLQAVTEQTLTDLASQTQVFQDLRSALLREKLDYPGLLQFGELVSSLYVDKEPKQEETPSSPVVSIRSDPYYWQWASEQSLSYRSKLFFK